MKSNLFNNDFVDFIKSLNQAEVEYVLIGGYSVIIHGYNRTTGDMDIFVNTTVKNYGKIVKAFKLFGMPLFGMTKDKFLNVAEYEVFEYGKPPVQIDLITKIDGLSFSEVYETSFMYQIDDNVGVRVIHLNQLKEAKKASGRLKDLDDLEKIK